MSLQFIFGASGAGKTEYIYRRFLREAEEAPGKRFFLLVPEQDTLQTQQGLVGHPQNAGRGILNIDVLSFNRLAYRVFEEQGVEALHIVDDMGKIMILRSVAEEVQGKLSLYRHQLNRPGFLSELKSQISELYQYRILPEMVDLAAERAESDYTRAKLRDLALLYEAFRAYMAEHGYLTQEEVLDRLYELLPDSRLLDGAVLALDGFSDFTPVQQDLAREMLRKAETVLCAVTTDDAARIYEKKTVEDLFYLSGQTVSRLVRLAKEADCPLLTAVDLNRFDAVSGAPRGAEERLPRFADAPQLDCLQRYLFRYSGARCQETGGIRILEAQDQGAEMEALAAEIARSVREDGLRYRDIGVIVTDPHAYRDLIYEAFSNAGIPYFIDAGKSLLDSPYAEVLRAALEVLDDGFSYESVLRCLRALPPEDAAAADRLDQLDNWLRERGIRGAKRFSEPWEALEEERQALIGPLLRLRAAMRGAEAQAAARVEAARSFLLETEAAARVEALAERLSAAGEQNRAQEYIQGIAQIDKVLARLQELLGEGRVSLGEFRDILDAGLAEAKVTVIPATLDQVIIGDLTRSRFAAPRRFFVAGVNADQIPKAETRARIISDQDRALFDALELTLAPTAQENALIQRFYLYRALLNPSEELTVSYPLKGRGGRGLRPSSLVGELLKLFPSLRVERLRYRRRRLYTPKEGLRYLACGLAETTARGELPEDALFAADLRVLANDAAFRQTAIRLLEAAFTRYTSTQLDRRAAEAVYGEVLRGSITRLELYNRCAFAHFLKFGLKLAERKNFEVQAFDIGNLYHTALEACFRCAMEAGRELFEFDEAELQALVRACVEEAVAGYDSAALRDTARSRYLVKKVEDVTRTTLWALSEQLRRGDFRVRALEREFDLIQDGLRLSGRIDRIDTCESGGNIYVKVIDYKSGRTEFDLNQIYSGLQLQLSVYMDVALRQLQLRHPDAAVEPAAMFYYHIADPILPYDAARSAAEGEKERLRALRADGLVNTDLEIVQHLDREIEKESDVIPVTIKKGLVDASKRSVASTARFEALQAHVRRTLERSAAEIRDGVITIAPVRLSQDRTACTYCPYHAVCGFDPRLDGFSYRKPGKRRLEEVWEEILKNH